MKRRATSEYIWLGTALRYCADAKEGYLIGGDGGVAFNLRRFLEELDNLSFPVTQSTALRWTKLRAMLESFEEADDDALLTADQAAALTTEMDHM